VWRCIFPFFCSSRRTAEYREKSIAGFGGENAADRTFEFDSVEYHISAASAADDAHVAADAQYPKLAASAGVRLFHFQNIVRSEPQDFHRFSSVSDRNNISL
jgi:hypothetical protein